MPKLKPNQVPAYRLHKQSGQAIVTLSGKDHLLGAHGSKESRTKYDRLVSEWMANGRRASYRGVEGISVSRLIAEFWAHARTYYAAPREGQTSGEADNHRLALIPLRKLYGATSAGAFGPLQLAALQQEMVRMGWCRTYANRQVNRIKHVFKWGVSKGMVSAGVYHGLATVAGLRKGRSEARESDPVKPVAESHVEATLTAGGLPRQVKGMIRLQLLTGMRPGEVVIMRGRDIDTAGKVWVYKPEYHKNEHHDIAREIRLGPKAQAIISTFWKPDLSAYLFSPVEAEAERRAELSKRRKTPLSCGNVPGSNVTRRPARRPGDRYTVASYRKAIARACAKSFPLPDELTRERVKGAKGNRWETSAEWRARLGAEKWTLARGWAAEHEWAPNQLRHTAATRLRREFGIDVAQSILGHRLGSNVTEVYAEVDAAKLAGIVERVG